MDILLSLSQLLFWLGILYKCTPEFFVGFTDLKCFFQMKLEKKRSSSMDKIMNKLRSAQKKAQEMRTLVLSNQAHHVPRTSHKAMSFRRTRQMGSLSGCFTCHAFQCLNLPILLSFNQLNMPVTPQIPSLFKKFNIFFSQIVYFEVLDMTFQFPDLLRWLMFAKMLENQL